MQLEVRQARIEDHLSKVEFASLDELSELVDASISTVRRDLDVLEARGILRRTHGGARLTNPKSDEFAFSARDAMQSLEKDAIARACAELILPNQTVIVDAGSTCAQVAKYLEAKSPHIITNSLPVANTFSSSARLEVVVTGGVIYPRLGVLVGPLAVAALSQVHADVAIMSCGGITPDVITNSHGLLIEIQRAMMRAARRVVLCVDHTKFGRQSISQLGTLDSIDTLITDQDPPDEMLIALGRAGVELLIAHPDGSKRIPPNQIRPPPIEGHQRSASRSVKGPSTDPEAFLD